MAKGITCPQENLDEWKKLTELIPNTAIAVWDKMGGQIDDKGHPLINRDKFFDLLKFNKGDYTRTYSNFLAIGGDKLVTDPSEIKEKIMVTKKDEVKDTLNHQPLTISQEALKSNLTSLEGFDKVRNNALQRLMIKSLIVNRGELLPKDDTRRAEFEELIKQIKDNGAEEALNTYLSEGSKVIHSIWNEYNSRKEELQKIEDGKSTRNKKDVLNLEMLKRWKDIVGAYDSLDEFQDELLERNKMFDTKDEEAQKRNYILQDAITIKNKIKSLYNTVGLDILSEELSKHYDQFRNETKDIANKDYDQLPEDIKQTFTKPEWKNLQVEMNKQDLDQRTQKLIKEQLQVASKDINVITRWLGSLANTQDPAIAAAYKMMIHADLQSSNHLMKSITKISNVLEDIEKQFGKGYNKQKIFNIILEKGDDGKLTGSIINKFSSKFWNERDKFFKELEEKNYKPDVKAKLISDWNNKYCPEDKESYGKDLHELLSSLREKGTLSDNEYALIKDIEGSYTKDKNYAHDLHQRGLLNIIAADEIGKFKAEGAWKYREPSREFKNKEWDSFNKLSEESPIKKFYETFNELLEEANSMLPFHTRLKPGQLPAVMKTIAEKIATGASIKEVGSLLLAKTFDVLADDPDRSEQRIADQDGNIRNFIPTRYTNPLAKFTIYDVNGKEVNRFKNKGLAEKYLEAHKGEGYTLETQFTPEDQSYDLPTVLAMFCKMAYDYNYKKEISSELEAIQYFVDNRKIKQTDSSGKEIKRRLKTKDKGVIEDIQSATDTYKPKVSNHMADQYRDWLATNLYGNKEQGGPRLNVFGMHIDMVKGLNLMNKSTSLTLLAVNARAAINYVVVSEQARIGEMLAGEHMSKKSWLKGDKVFFQHMPGMMADCGKRDKRDLVNKLFHGFGISAEPIDTNLADATRLGKVAKSSALYFLMKQGVFFTQTRFFLGMLADIKAYDKDGKVLGDMVDMYHVDDKGFLQLDSRMDPVKSGWTDKDKENFIIKTRSLIDTIHGEYGATERAAVERIALGRMGTMFRKFIVPGVIRRYKKGGYSERLGSYTEGYYRTTGKFITSLAKDLKQYKLAVLSHNWEKLTNHERANIIRTMNDVAFTLTAMILSGIFLHEAKSSEQDTYERQMWSMLAYQSLRFKSEMLLYTPKLDEAISILKSPTASLGMLEGWSKLTSQAFTDAGRMMHGEGPQIITQGKRKGMTRFRRDVGNVIPGFRSIESEQYVQDQLRFMDQGLILNPLGTSGEISK
jgi:hypothetical protein